jgi:hypothetical protein
VSEGIPFLGFTIFTDHRRLKRRKGLAYRRRLRQNLRKLPFDQVEISLRGWINHVRYADTFGLRRALLEEFGLLAMEGPYV